MDNYFEGIDFTKIEIILLLGVVLVLSPFLLFQVEYNTSAIEELEEEFDEIKAKNLIDKLSNDQKRFEYSKTHTQISSTINNAISDQEVIIADAIIAKQEARDVIEELSNKKKLGLFEKSLNLEDFKIELEIDKEKAKIVTEHEIEIIALEKIEDLEKSKVEIDIAIYKSLKSYEFQNRIFFAFGIAIIILIVSVYLSRKGYTSYTPWLEKLSDDKLAFDLKLLQYVDKDELKKFYNSEFKLNVNLEDVEDKEVLGWRPLDEDVKWYSVFTEKMDYKFYEIFFENVQYEYGDLNYGDNTDDQGEWIAKKKKEVILNEEEEEKFRIMDLYHNSELVPKTNNEIRYELDKLLESKDLPKRCSKCQIKKFEHHEEFLEHMRVEHKSTELTIDTLYDKILLAMPIFELGLDHKKQKKLKKILIRKIQIDLLYYSVMMNFRRGLVVATEEWALADHKLKKTELNQVTEDAEVLDLAAMDLRDTVRGIINDINKKFHDNGDDELEELKNISEKELMRKVAKLIPFLNGVVVDAYDDEELKEKNEELKEYLKDLEKVFGTQYSEKKKISKDELKMKIEEVIPFLKGVVDEDYNVNVSDELKMNLARNLIPLLKGVVKNLSEEEEVDEKTRNKIDGIKDKMANRNKWNSDDWRAMGSIYYKWREGGKGGSNEIGIDEQEDTLVEKFWFWWNFTRKHLDKERMILDPTENAWKESRTIRAVNSLQKSFGYKQEDATGKAVIFFGVVFALIISTALLNSLDIVIETMQLPLNCDPDCYHTEWEFLKSNFGEYQYLFILFLCFFPLGILFYHQGTILLSDKAAEQMTLGSNALVFVNFLFILVQAVIIYFLASSIGDVSAFLSFLILLVTVDAIWVTIFMLNDMRDDVQDAPVFLEWIVFDIVIGLFAGIFLINYASAPPILEEDGWGQNLHIFLMLFALLFTRAVVDYSYGWKNFWSKFAGAE